MNNPSNVSYRLKNCIKHNQPITFYSPQDKTSFCQLCIQERAGLISFDQINQKLNELQMKGNKEYEELKQQLQQLLDSLLTHKQNIITRIDKIIQLTMDQIKSISSLKEDFSKKIQNNIEYEQQIIDIDKELQNIYNNNQQVKEEIKQQIQLFQQKFKNVNQMLEMFKQNQKEVEIDTITIPKKIAIQQVKTQVKNYSEKFEYELIKEFTKKENTSCHSFAFNRDNTILLVGQYKQIIVYEFNNGKIQKELQRLCNHTDCVTCLYFMKQSNGFVSGNWDYQIIIWSNDKNNQWVVQQILKDHNSSSTCLLMNNKEDLLISGSDDCTIKFWSKNNDSWKCQQTINSNNLVRALSLNEEQNKLISCGNMSKILIFEVQQSDQQWILAQTINVNERGYRLCFTLGNQFVFQPKTSDYLEVYNFDNLKKWFSKITQVQVQKCNNCHLYFPCQFIKQLNILTAKHGNFLNILKVNQDGNYELMQTIKYKRDYNLYGRITNDGKYLVTWNEDSSEMQVRQLKKNVI